MAGLTGFSLVYLIYVLQPPLPGLVAAQVLRGVAFAAFTATALTMAIDLAPPEARGRASSLFTAAQGLSQITGNWVGGPLAAALGFRALFALGAATERPRSRRRRSRPEVLVRGARSRRLDRSRGLPRPEPGD